MFIKNPVVPTINNGQTLSVGYSFTVSPIDGSLIRGEVIKMSVDGEVIYEKPDCSTRATPNCSALNDANNQRTHTDCIDKPS